SPRSRSTSSGTDCETPSIRGPGGDLRSERRVQQLRLNIRESPGMEGGSVTKKGYLRVLALAGVLSIAAAACGGGGAGPAPSGSASGGGPTKGGTYRTAVEDFGFTGAFDPTGEYL